MRRIRSVVTVLVTTLVAVGLMTPSGSAAADPPPTTTYYLALGDSLAFGYPTGVGYADDLQQVLKFAHPRIELIKLGCPGESTATMISGGEPCASTDRMSSSATQPTSWTQRSGYSSTRRLTT